MSILFNKDTRVNEIGGNFQLFQIHGSLYHRQGPLVPAGRPVDARFSQVYLYDPAEAATARAGGAEGLDPNLIASLTMMLQRSNPLIQLYLSAREQYAKISEEGGDACLILNPQLSLVVERGADRRRENLATGDEVAMILPEEYSEQGMRDIVLGKSPNREDVGAFTIINPNHALYLPLHYVLLFPNGELGWHWSRTLFNRPDKRLTQRSFYR